MKKKIPTMIRLLVIITLAAKGMCCIALEEAE